MSPKRVENVECPRCHRVIRDTGADTITCHYCGYTMDRSEISTGAVEGGKDLLVAELTHNVKMYKFTRNIAFVVAALCLLTPLLIILLIDYTDYIGIGATFVPALVWLAIGTTYSQKVEKTRSKLFDIVGERELIE